MALPRDSSHFISRDKEDHVKVLSYNTESTALEAESKLRNVIRHNFSAARSAFLKFDPKQKRRVSLLDLRQVLAAEWNITMSDSEFEKFKACGPLPLCLL